MREEDVKKQRLSLTLVFSGLIFAFLVATMVVAAVIVYLFVRFGFLKAGEGNVNIGSLMVFTALISVVIGTILSATVGRIPLRSANDVINALNRLASGDFKARLNYTGIFRNIPAIKEFSDSFNKMATELENTEMLRTDFINNFSHEFKTPIVSIAGFAKLLRKGNVSDAEREEYLGIIEDEAMRLSSMATSVLDMTRIENKEILTDFTLYNLSEQIRKCVLLLEDKWTKKHLEFDLNFEEYQILANEDMLRQVWVNLLDNAVKFTPEYGIIEIHIREEKDRISVSVINTGSEISEENKDRIFQKFYQADESHSMEGNGIGLAVVKKIVELHRGTIETKSGKGQTSFTVTLPQTERLLSID